MLDITHGGNHLKMYFDESGFTGSDYCNEDQPLFVLACTWFDDDYSVAIEKEIVNKMGCKEVKFSQLIRSGKGRGEVSEIIEKFNTDEAKLRYAAYVVHKKSALVRKFVDDCIEPSFHLEGINIYEDGLNISYANIISANLPVFMGSDWYKEFLCLYNSLIRSKENKDNLALYNHCLKTKQQKNAYEILMPYLTSPALVMEEITDASYHEDVYESIMLGLIVHIRHEFGITDFNILMDMTKVTTAPRLSSFLRHLELLTKMHKMSDVCTVHPDIRVTGVNMVDSCKVIGVRMSDLVAGLFSWSFKSADNLDSVIAKKLTMKMDDKNLIHMINSQQFNPVSFGMRGTSNPWV